MTVFNGEKYLSQAIESLLDQEFPQEGYNIIVVDDGSTDRTASILESYKTKSGRITILTNETNRGIGYSANRALEEIRSEFVIRFDADDIACRNLLSSLYDSIGQYAFCHPFMEIFYGDDISKKEIYKVRDFATFFASGVMFRRDLMKKIRYSDLFWEEFDLYLQILEQKTSYLILPECLFLHRVHSQNMTSDKNKFVNGYHALAEKWGEAILNKYG